MDTQYLTHTSQKDLEKASSEVGALLQKKREDMNLSLKEVESMTSIRVHHLRSLEEGSIHKHLSPVYAQGFLVQYGRFLNLDPEQLKQTHPVLFKKMPSQQDFAYGIGTLEIRATSNGGVKWIPNAMWLITSLGIIGVAWILAKYFELI